MNTSLSSLNSYDSDDLVSNALLTVNCDTGILGVQMDGNLSFKAYVDILVSKCNSHLFVIPKLTTQV